MWRSGEAWVFSDPSIFPEAMTERLPLPPGGEWVEIPSALVGVPDAG